MHAAPQKQELEPNSLLRRLAHVLADQAAERKRRKREESAGSRETQVGAEEARGKLWETLVISSSQMFVVARKSFQEDCL